MTVTARPLTEQASTVLLVVSIVLELINATIPLILVLGSVAMLPTILVGTTAVPRAIAFFVSSYGEPRALRCLFARFSFFPLSPL